MGVDDMRDMHTGPLGLGDEPVFVAGNHVDRDGFLQAGAAEEVRERGVGCGALAEEHDRLLV
jgi:hypothetical protein